MLGAQGEVTRSTFRHREASLACAPASFVFNVRLCFRSFRSFRSRGFSRLCFRSFRPFPEPRLQQVFQQVFQL